jgi:hypothetical protein
MNKKTIFLLILIIITISYSYLNIPRKFETEGGSCYQGITAMLIRFFLIVCGFLSLISVIIINYKSKVKTAKTLIVLSLIIWITGTIIHSYDNALIGIKYFSPLLILNFIIAIQVYNNKKIKQSN